MSEKVSTWTCKILLSMLFIVTLLVLKSAILLNIIRLLLSIACSHNCVYVVLYSFYQWTDDEAKHKRVKDIEIKRSDYLYWVKILGSRFNQTETVDWIVYLGHDIYIISRVNSLWRIDHIKQQTLATQTCLVHIAYAGLTVLTQW